MQMPTTPQARLRLLAVLAAIAAAVIAAATWSGRPLPVSPVATIDAGTKAVAALDAIKLVMAGIADEASANAALPRLREQSARLLDIRDAAELAPTARAALAKAIGPLLPDFDARAAATLRVAGVEPVVGPLLRQITERLRALAGG